MGILLEDIIELTVDTSYEIYIYDNELEENVYNGTLEDIPEDIIGAEISSWEMDCGRLGFSIH